MLTSSSRPARAGKAVLCEKPIDLDLARVLECEAAIRGLGRTVMIGFNRRFDPSFRALRQRVQGGRNRQRRAGDHYKSRSLAAAGNLCSDIGRLVP
jgi:predicted dehydrogenase